jgi:hypothetical protein
MKSITKQTSLLAALALFTAGISGCAIAGAGVVTGAIYSGYQVGSSVGPAAPAKTGEACAMSILGAVAVGDASVDAAKKAGGITQVATIDHKSFGVLSIYANVCTVVTGS